ncbi:DUF3253 domain-containing protein [Botrimarina hoheduenensis]|uniref:S-adenosylmethionine tRNA ribosyltransferase n=1 Tax=Botrimarina hoheduenensis TaxID=2528000 RepID=A0A5C5VZV7_9BACT|nr:DUF3253 domain-containing protein [Botrimarina hoheduenensis]TWT43339.1 hypothetical protein Pla111_22900 [Botrimarina hoheduenensis]
MSAATAPGNDPDKLAEQLEVAMLALLAHRGVGKTICPSEAARRVQPDDWRPLMDLTRTVACQLIDQGRLVATQRGIAVDLVNVHGPIRLRLPVP